MLKRDAYKDIVSELRSTRKFRGVSQEEMAKRLNVSQGVISNFESVVRREQKPDFIISYANALASVEAKRPASNIDKYSEFVSVLRGIRESYRVTQEEMAVILKVDPSTVSKFESANQDVKLDFLIFYTSLLGYNVKVGSTFMSRGEFSRFRGRQSRISRALHYIQRWQIESIFNSDVYGRAWWPEDAVGENGSRIISELLRAKKTAELTTKKLSEKLGVSERTIQRFERENYTPSASFAFKYAALVNMELRLEKILRCKREILGAFYIRRSLVLHNWIRSLADTNSSGA